jgi:acyl-CoA thioester hydrolase
MGMTPGWFQKHKIGPVLFKEETEYKKEVHMGQRLRVTVDSAAPTEFSKSVQLIQYVYTEEGELSAIHRCVVAWMSLEKRKVIELPDQIKRTLPNKVNEPAEEQVA